MKRFLVCFFLILAACSPYSGPLIGSSESAAESGTDTNVSGGDMSAVVPGDDGGSAVTDDGGDGGNTSDAAIAPPDCGDGGTVYTHNNGAGDTWQDCVPLGTYDMTEALSACAALCRDGSCTCAWGSAELPSADAGSEHISRAHDNATQAVTWTWAWDGPYAGRASNNGAYPPYGNLVSWE